MLNALELLLEAPLRAALPAGTGLAFAAAEHAPADRLPQLALFAAGLSRVAPAPGGEAEIAREAAYARATLQLAAHPSNPKLFPLPPDATGTVAEVESPVGHLLPQADAWVVDAEGLRLLSVPASAPVATLRGGPVRGYVERWPAQAELRLSAWAPSSAAASDLLGRGLSALLAAFVGLDLVTLRAAPEAGGLTVRLLRPVARLQDLGRGSETVLAAEWQRCTARVLVMGELEQTLALGSPDPAATIRRIDLGLDWSRADAGTRHADSKIGGA